MCDCPMLDLMICPRSEYYDRVSHSVRREAILILIDHSKIDNQISTTNQSRDAFNGNLHSLSDPASSKGPNPTLQASHSTSSLPSQQPHTDLLSNHRSFLTRPNSSTASRTVNHHEARNWRFNRLRRHRSTYPGPQKPCNHLNRRPRPTRGHNVNRGRL
jgi:hypothetical protein